MMWVALGVGLSLMLFAALPLAIGKLVEKLYGKLERPPK
jgi:hypothetical protein